MKENNNYKNGYVLSGGIAKEEQGKIDLLCEMTKKNKSELVRSMISFIANHVNEFLEEVKEEEV